MSDYTFTNPLFDGKDDSFTNYEIDSVRDYEAPDGTRFTEPCEPDDDDSGGQACSDVYWTIYGHMKVGGVEALIDCRTEEEAVDTLRKMGIKP